MGELNIYQRINAVRKKVEYVQKDATVNGGGTYRAVTHDMVTAVLRDALIENGIVVITDQRMSESIPVGSTKNGAPIIRYEAWYEVSFINIEKPDDRLSIRVQAHANDSADKAPGKAMSYAVKYAMLKTFSLETGENEESRMENDRRGKLVIEHLKDELNEYIDSGDALGVFLFEHSVGQEMWTDLYNSAPNGKKTEFKNKLNEMTKVGHEILVEINQGILQGDEFKVKENVSDLTDNCKRKLMNHLGQEKTQALIALTKKEAH